MKAEWYYTQGGQQLGPFTAADMKKFAEDGKLKSDDLVWKEGMANWVAAKAVKGIFPAAPPPPVSRPAGVEPAGRVVTGGPADDFAYDAPSPRIKSPAKRQAEDVREDSADEEEQRTDFDDRPTVPRREAGGLMAYLTFQKMVVPVVIQIIFWLGVLASFGYAAISFIMVAKYGNFDIVYILFGGISSVVTLLFSLLFVRIYCELLIVSFRILGTLVDIKELLQKRP